MSLFAFFCFFLLPSAFGFSWTWNRPVQQCSNITISVNGTDFVPPLKAILVPVGPSGLTFEVRKVIEMAFPPSATEVTSSLPYPAESQFTVLVFDGRGYGNETLARSGIVEASSDSTCFDSTKNAVNPFTFGVSPADVAECQDVRIYWNSDMVQGIPSFIYVIPEDRSGVIPLSKIDRQFDHGTGFIWTPAVPAKKNLIIIGGDNRGMGAGGFFSTYVNPSDLISDESGGCPTPTPRNASPNIGAIVGGVIGGIVAIGVLLVILLRFRPRKETTPKPVCPQTDSPFNAPNVVEQRGNITFTDPLPSPPLSLPMSVQRRDSPINIGQNTLPAYTVNQPQPSVGVMKDVQQASISPWMRPPA